MPPAASTPPALYRVIAVVHSVASTRPCGKLPKHYLKRHQIHFQPGINEDLAATAVWGSQQTNLFSGARYDGVFGLWYGKGPGVDRSMDVLKHANAFGTSRFGGVLAVAGDDHACKSSTLPHQSEHMFIGASIPVLAPADVQEVLDLGIYGWELSRYCGCWVGFKAITENMDSAISADINPGRVSIQIPETFNLPTDGVHARWPDSPMEQEKRLNKYKIYAAREFAYANELNKVMLDSARPRLGIITSGKAYLDVIQALDDMGIDAQARRSHWDSRLQGGHAVAIRATKHPSVRGGTGRDPGCRGKTLRH